MVPQADVNGLNRKGRFRGWLNVLSVRFRLVVSLLCCRMVVDDWSHPALIAAKQCIPFMKRSREASVLYMLPNTCSAFPYYVNLPQS